MEVIWVQTFNKECEVVAFVGGEKPTEGDINLFWNDSDKTKRFVRAEIHEESRKVERILDVENGWDLTDNTWARKLITSVLADHHG